MKTLADFKRAMVKGSQWYRKHVNESAWTERTVSKVCSNGVWIMNNEGKEARLDFPKASEFAINEAGEAEIYWPATHTYEGVNRIEIPRRLVLTYRRAGK